MTTEEEYRRLWLGEWVPDQRYIDLYKHLQQYYKDTPDSMDSRQARPHWILFNKWCRDRGYTPEEINKAKRDINP